ncbi:uncharacterized protein [Nicotiana tomentosiformis]|uniref:uncharacterized protein n=1 Tax=Nicotiana tomentosiformis TaxID=4098 RepID=UPI00388CED0C
MIWYHNLPPNSIYSFAMLVDAFVKDHAEAIKAETRKSDLFKVNQRDNEILREFVSRFQMEQMEMPPDADDWDVHAFTQGLNPRSSLASQQLKQNLVEYPAVTWADVHNRPLEGREAPSLLEYNFNVDATSIVSAIGRIKETKWPRPLQSDPTQRDPNLMCKYHGTHGHMTEDYLQLREEVARLFNNGHLQEFLSD